jgi:nondiscriminating aspartyl-tRNA synthetase
MERTYIKDLREKIGSEAKIAGFVHARRDHGKIIFIDLRDVTGKLQLVVLPTIAVNHKLAEEIRSEWVVEVVGKINRRAEKLINADEPNGDIEMEVKSIHVLSRAKELPFALGEAVNIDTHLDYLPLTLRDEKHRAIFKVQATITEAFRDFFTAEGFTEFQAPKLIGDDAEGGANSFNVEYFKHIAHLAQSPQLYKQIMVGVFERVFTIGNVYRAEKHSTTRHLNEYTSLDIEMGFIKDHTEVMAVENKFLIFLEKALRARHKDDFSLLGAEIPSVPPQIPSLKLREAQKLISLETNREVAREDDLEPEQERWLCDYAKRQFNSDFIFVTHFPTIKRPFYTYRDEIDPTYTKGFDLLFRGVEITTGAQRIHDYDTLVASLKEKGLNPDRFSFYLQAFKYGLPPHGGFGMGLERLTQKLLNLGNVKEATLFPRDLNRIDLLLSR